MSLSSPRSLLLTATLSTLIFGGTTWLKPVFAGTSGISLEISATVSPNCYISVPTAVSFGSYDPTSGSAKTTTGSVQVTCTAGASPVFITLGQGLHPASGSTDENPLRRMKNSSGDDYLSYSLYRDAGYSTVWGNTQATAVSLTGTGGLQDFTVYGNIPSSQNVPSGSYNDSVQAIVNF